VKVWRPVVYVRPLPGGMHLVMEEGSRPAARAPEKADAVREESAHSIPGETKVIPGVPTPLGIL
jgi:hypothetical protein